jgi:hypothetical protein
MHVQQFASLQRHRSWRLVSNHGNPRLDVPPTGAAGQLEKRRRLSTEKSVWSPMADTKNRATGAQSAATSDQNLEAKTPVTRESHRSLAPVTCDLGPVSSHWNPVTYFSIVLNCAVALDTARPPPMLRTMHTGFWRATNCQGGGANRMNLPGRYVKDRLSKGQVEPR